MTRLVLNRPQVAGLQVPGDEWEQEAENWHTVTEAKELARHSDVRMTMKYTHVGLKDQAKALANLPAPIRGVPRSISWADSR